MSSHKKNSKKEHWYDVNVVVEVLIGELPKGERYAPEISNLCIGFTMLTQEGLAEEIEDMRLHWPFVFPRQVPTSDILKIVKKKYDNYQELMKLQEVE